MGADQGGTEGGTDSEKIDCYSMVPFNTQYFPMLQNLDSTEIYCIVRPQICLI